MNGRAIPAPWPAAALAAASAAAAGLLRLAADDARVPPCAAAALALAEAFLGQALIARGWTQVLAGAEGWQALAIGPVSAIAPPTAPDGSALAVGAYRVDITADGTGLVSLAPAVTASVSFTAGLAADWAALPEPIAQGVALLAAHLHEGIDGAAPPAAVSALWRPWLRLRL